ncbi:MULTISPECIES: OmpA family protein [unclassified Oceanispirochaeta]|uniref:OmpA family protein n=1 Tax=unclassified Oceanispirochaeta TaxID=2635722 RepID=UPI000E09C5C8|nr:MULTISPECIES: OmpA family protein [unclassified Oceanispirochaeta]MBF9017933.1 OmpA family protein [Oceanispirochaeta sp. M2]NPD74444.1 OmpA family protein [Oceanispirochaeta sp. M1]RDG29745.1 hypothetical protein DV872_20285 [Oceanispirochaeta sp. M1]
MKRRILIWILIILASSLTAQDIYPGRTYSVVPEFFSGFFLPLGEGKIGGGIETGLSVVDFIPRVRMGLAGGYGFLSDDNSQALPFPYFSLKGGYRVPLGELFSFYPGAVFSMYWPLEESGISMKASIAASAMFDMHLYKRNYLSLETSLSFPFSSELPPYLSINLGVKHSIPFKRSVPPVDLELLVRPEIFSPDGDGEADVLELVPIIENPSSVKKWTFRIFDKTGVQIYSQSGKGAPPPAISWDGYASNNILVSSAADFSLELELFDILGYRIMREGSFITDVFVFRENGKLKIRVPGIIFPPGSSDFSRLTDEEVEQNREIIRKIAATLWKFPEYRILIEGHGNLIHWSSDELAAIEQKEVLLPLSESRAAAVRDVLAEEGIPLLRLDVAGRGGEFPLIPFEDEQNRWRNRRVEFILLK